MIVPIYADVQTIDSSTCKHTANCRYGVPVVVYRYASLLYLK
jgi:hypothetical protein